MSEYPDINYHDIDGHMIVPGAWLHMIRFEVMQAFQVVRYASWGALWVCWVRLDSGLQAPVTDSGCLHASVRLRSPLQPDTIEWKYLENRLLGKDGLPPERRLSTQLAELLANSGYIFGKRRGEPLAAGHVLTPDPVDLDDLATLLIKAANAAQVLVRERDELGASR